MVARPWSSSRLSCGERLLLRCDGIAGMLSGQAGKVSVISSYQEETELLWMWAGPSCFLSSREGNDGDLLELPQGCEVPFRSSRG